MSFSVHLRWNVRRKNFGNFFLENFHSTKRFVFEFQGESLDQFLTMVLISAVISILEDFRSLLPARPVAVQCKNDKCWYKSGTTVKQNNPLEAILDEFRRPGRERK